MEDVLKSKFDKVYCINLKHREDRWEACVSQFNEQNLLVERYEAINGKERFPNGNKLLKSGEIGLLKCHLDIINEAQSNKYQQIVIFEDDVEFNPDFSIKFNEFYRKVPSDWGFLYFGATHVKPVIQVNDKIARLVKSKTTHAICIRSTIYGLLLKELKKEREPVDRTYARLHSRIPSYVFQPHLAWQSESYSDIQEKEVNYTHLKG